MKTLILIIMALLFTACGEEEPTTIYKDKHIYVYVECVREIEERCEKYNCTEKERAKSIEDFCVVEEE